MSRRRTGSPPALPCGVALIAMLAMVPSARAQQSRTDASYGSATPVTTLPIARFRQGDESFLQFSGVNDSLRVVIRDSTTWRQYWQMMNRPFLPAPALPVVDFSREVVVLAALGRQRSGGYAIRIEGAVVDSSGISVVVRRSAPGSSCAVAAVVTQPVDIARLPSSSTRVSFVERQEIADCRRP